MAQKQQAIARMWSRRGGGLRSFARRMRCGRGCRKSCGRQRRSWRGGTGSTATARVLDVDRPSLQKWTDRFEPRAPQSRRSLRASIGWTGVPRPPSWNCWRRVRHGNQLCGGSRISQRRKAAAGVEGHRHQPTGRVDSRVCGVVGHAADHAADADSGGGGSRRFPQGHRLVGRVVPRQTRMPIRSRAACLCSAAGGRPLLRCWSTTGRDFGWRPSVYPKDAFAGGRKARKPARALRVHQVQVLLAAGNPDIDAAPVWRKV